MMDTDAKHGGKHQRNKDENKQTTTTAENTNDTGIKPLFPTPLRFKIMADNAASARQQHKQVLQTFIEEFKQCDIYSSNNEKITNINDSDSFQFHEQGTQHFIIAHRIVIDSPYHSIKKNKLILESLKKNKCFMTQHLWTNKEWNIVNIGFLCGASPKHQSKDSIKHRLETIKPTNLRFNLHATMIRTMHNNQLYKTYAYEIECNQTDAEAIGMYIGKTCQEINQTFIKYKWKYTNADVFVSAMNKQNDFVANIRTIPVYGIIPEAMQNMYNNIIRSTNTLDISKTGKTSTHGRWNIYTPYKDFKSTTIWLQENLDTLYRTDGHHNPKDVPTNFVPEVRFSTTINFNDNQSDQLLTDAEESVKSHSAATSTARTWASVASSNTPSSITSASDILNSIQRLSDSINRICTRLDNIEAQLNMQQQAIDMSQQFQNASTINEDTKQICNRLDKIEETLATQAATHKTQQFETCKSDSNTTNQTDNFASLNRLGEMINRLEERTNSINCRKQRLTEDQTRPNKRQDFKQTPTKCTNQTQRHEYVPP